MPLFAAFIGSILTKFYNAIVYLVGAQFASRVAVALAIANSYFAMVIVFNNYVNDWLGDLFNTNYGQFLGLLFPPVAGPVLARLTAFWTVVIMHHYVRGLTKMAIG